MIRPLKGLIEPASVYRFDFPSPFTRKILYCEFCDLERPLEETSLFKLLFSTKILFFEKTGPKKQNCQFKPKFGT